MTNKIILHGPILFAIHKKLITDHRDQSFLSLYCNIMAKDFVLYILPFGLVRLRTFRLAHGLVRRKHERRCSRTHREDASFTDIKIKPQMRNGTRRCEWRHTPEAWAEIWEKVSELSSCLRRRRLTFRARRGLAAGTTRGGGGGGVQMEKSG